MTSSTAPAGPATRGHGVEIALGLMVDGGSSVASDKWALGRWIIQFISLDAHHEFALDPGSGDTFVKVVTGRLLEPDRGAYAEAKVVRTTRVASGSIQAGPGGALVMVIVDSSPTDMAISSIQELAVDGPLSHTLRWRSMDDHVGSRSDAFAGLDAHVAPGFHLIDSDGHEIAYIYVWAAGKGVDMSTHDHSRAPTPNWPAFGEVHLVLSNGTGEGGMYETPQPGSVVRDRFVMQRGDEHGPFFEVQPNGRPRERDNAAVLYPWHGWQAGSDEHDGQAYDVVVAFEITAPYAIVGA